MAKLIFENWEERCSSLGNILTNKKVWTEENEKRVKELECERDLGINKNGNKVKWTQTKQDELEKLIDKRDGPDQLPAGAITHLEDVFRREFWGRERILNNKYLDKGKICEEDALDLKSKVDGQFYKKNKEKLSNGYIKGEPDNRQDIIRDAKSNFDMESFDKAELTSQYEWQIKGYCWLDGKTKGELFYALVNNPWHQLEAEKKRVWYSMGMPEEQEERWQQVALQVEQNMIFDYEKFMKDNPNGDLIMQDNRYDIPAKLRIKSFDVTLTQEDIDFIKSRALLAREWLINKEIETLKLING